MCGIAAIVSDEYVDKSYIKKMTDVIVHRGPDSEGQESLLDGRVLLGHRRLSILDLSMAGKQPMSYMNGRYWITYNGEVYNYIELRKELEQHGYVFKSDTDTEVVMAAYDFWGKECLHRFNGMWAFVILDTLTKKIFVARDRFGVKPLYYWKSPTGFIAIASEIKQFMVLPAWQYKINGQRSYDYLKWGLTDHTNETLYANVYQLRPGHAMECSLERIDDSWPIYQWYKLSGRKKFLGDYGTAVDQFLNLFTDAVMLRLRSDVHVGACLSGGLDSSSIVCVINDILKKRNNECLQRTVSACSKTAKYDERKYIDNVLFCRNIKGYYIYPELEDLFKKVKKITWYQDEPFGSTSIYAQWCVFEMAKYNDLQVILDGQGADEQLAGYHGFFAPRFAGLLKSLKLIELLREIQACKHIHKYDMLFVLKGVLFELLPNTVYDFLCGYYNGNTAVPTWLDMKKIDAIAKNPYIVAGNKTTTIRNLSIAQLTSSNLQMLLHWEDRNSMAHSIETRLPFLDYRLVEFVLGLPDDYKLSRGVTKKILRDSMKGIIPDAIRWRMDKMGFVTPEEVWVRKNPSSFREYLKLSINVTDGIIKNDIIDYFDAMLEYKRPFDFTIWRIINFGIWLDSRK